MDFRPRNTAADGASKEVGSQASKSHAKTFPATKTHLILDFFSQMADFSLMEVSGVDGNGTLGFPSSRRSFFIIE